MTNDDTDGSDAPWKPSVDEANALVWARDLAATHRAIQANIDLTGIRRVLDQFAQQSAVLVSRQLAAIAQTGAEAAGTHAAALLAKQMTVNITPAINALIAAQTRERVSTGQAAAMLLQLRGVMDVAHAADAASATVTKAPPHDEATTTIARTGDWGITRKQRRLIASWLAIGLGAEVGLNTLIRDLVGEEPSELQTLYWTAAILAAITCLLLVVVKPSEWERNEPDS